MRPHGKNPPSRHILHRTATAVKKGRKESRFSAQNFGSGPLLEEGEADRAVPRWATEQEIIAPPRPPFLHRITGVLLPRSPGNSILSATDILHRSTDRPDEGEVCMEGEVRLQIDEKMEDVSTASSVSARSMENALT